MRHYGKMQRVARTILYDEQTGEDVISDILSSAYDFLQKHYEKEAGNGKDE